MLPQQDCICFCGGVPHAPGDRTCFRGSWAEATQTVALPWEASVLCYSFPFLITCSWLLVPTMTSGVLSLLCGSALSKQLQHTAVLYVCACSLCVDCAITASQVKSVNSEAPPCLGGFCPVSHPEPPHCMWDAGRSHGIWDPEFSPLRGTPLSGPAPVPPHLSVTLCTVFPSLSCRGMASLA